MRRRLRVDRLAELELQQGAEWYDEQEAGLGTRFWCAVDDVIGRLQDEPIVASTPVPDMPQDVPARRVFVPGFPYQVVFVEHGDEIRVIAVAHFSRRPTYWLDRLPR